MVTFVHQGLQHCDFPFGLFFLFSLFFRPLKQLRHIGILPHGLHGLLRQFYGVGDLFLINLAVDFSDSPLHLVASPLPVILFFFQCLGFRGQLPESILFWKFLDRLPRRL